MTAEPREPFSVGICNKPPWRRLWCTCGHPRADRDTPLVAQDSVDTDQVLDTRFKLFDSGSRFVSWYSELLEKTTRNGGHMRHKVLCHQHLVVPGQVHCVIGDLANSKVLWRRYWGEKKENQKKKILMPSITEDPPQRANANSRATSGCGVKSCQKKWTKCRQWPTRTPKINFLADEIVSLKTRGEWSLRMEGNYIILDLLLKVVNRWKISGLVNCHMLSCVSALSWSLTFWAVFSNVSLITDALTIHAAAFVLAVVETAQLCTAFSFVSTLTCAPSIDAAPSVVAVNRTGEHRAVISRVAFLTDALAIDTVTTGQAVIGTSFITAVFPSETFITDTLPVDAPAAVSAVVGAAQFTAVLTGEARMTHTMSLNALAAAIAVWGAGHDSAVLTSKAFLTHTLAVNTAPPVQAVVWTRQLRTVVPVKTNIAGTLSVYTLASVVTVVQTC